MKEQEKSVHISVMMEEALDGLELREGMTVVDATLGGGGYSREIIKKIGSNGTLIALDRDQDAIERFRETDAEIAGAHHIVHANYADVRIVLNDRAIDRVDAVVADLGISSDHLEQADRGFSFQKNGPLDMRMDSSKGNEATELVARASVDRLTTILRDYGDERYARRIANAIVAQRKETPITRTLQLAEIVSGAVPQRYRHGKIHPATRTFQALRIAVNDEYRHLRTFLTSAIDVLRPGGRCSVVSFHSGEDTIVKHTWRTDARGCICPPEVPVCQCEHEPRIRLVTKKPLRPTQEEITRNPRARSARLRICEKL